MHCPNRLELEVTDWFTRPIKALAARRLKNARYALDSDRTSLPHTAFDQFHYSFPPAAQLLALYTIKAHKLDPDTNLVFPIGIEPPQEVDFPQLAAFKALITFIQAAGVASTENYNEERSDLEEAGAEEESQRRGSSNIAIRDFIEEGIQAMVQAVTTGTVKMDKTPSSVQQDDDHPVDTAEEEDRRPTSAFLNFTMPTGLPKPRLAIDFHIDQHMQRQDARGRDRNAVAGQADLAAEEEVDEVGEGLAGAGGRGNGREGQGDDLDLEENFGGGGDENMEGREEHVSATGLVSHHSAQVVWEEVADVACDIVDSLDPVSSTKQFLSMDRTMKLHRKTLQNHRRKRQRALRMLSRRPIRVSRGNLTSRMRDPRE